VLETFLWFTVTLTSLPLINGEPPETLIRLTVDAMPAPEPALHYLLLPELKEMEPGNPIPNYLKCLLDQDFTQNRGSLGKSALKQADRAARMDKPDWQILPQLKTEGVGLLVPDLQKMRELASALQERFHAELTIRRFDQALVTAKTMFALSRHMGEHPTLIGDLVGMAIANIAIAPLEEMLTQPGCPNLYWALTNLPSPLVSIEKGIEGERALIDGELRRGGLSDTTPMTPEQLKKLAGYIDRLLEVESGKDTLNSRSWIGDRTKDAKYMIAARRRLAEYGFPEEQLARFPDAQVIWLDEKRAYEAERDREMKFMNLPTWQAVELMRKLPKPAKKGLLSGLAPALHKIRQAQGRLEQRIAFLRHVEAIRLFAAAHDGKLPAKLAEIDVPLPADPFTGKGFRYEVKDGVAHVRGSPPPGYEAVAAYNLHYEITIRK
jgi:hypothetical protein